MDHPGAHFPGWCIEGGCGRSIVEVNFEQKHGKAENGVLQCHTTLANQDSSSGIAHKHLQIPLITGHSQLMPCNPTPCPNFELKKKKSSNIWHLSTPCHLPPSYPGPFFCISAACDGLMHHPAGQHAFFKVWQLAGPDSSKKVEKSSIGNKTSSSLNFTHLSFTSSNS